MTSMTPTQPTATTTEALIERLRGPVFGTQTALDAATAIETWKTRAERLADMHRDMCVVAGEAVARAETAEAALEAALSSAPPGDGRMVSRAWKKFELWFFRDVSDEQRLKLFSLFGLPVDEIGKSHGHQSIALKHVRAMLSAALSQRGTDK